MSKKSPSPEELEPTLRPELDEALLALDELGHDDPEEALAMFETLPEPVQALPDFQLSLAYIYQRQGQLEATRDICRELLAVAPDHADTHHLLADVLEDLNAPREATEHFVTTLRLDKEAFESKSEVEDDDVTADPHLVDRAGRILKKAVEGLPAEFKERMAHVPLLVELFPTEEQVRDGLDPRILGLFEGNRHVDDLTALGTDRVHRVVIYAANLAAEFPEPEDFDAQVRITALHEIGHYFGLEEDDMSRLGLD